LEAFLAQDEQSQEDKRCILPWIHQYGDLSGEYALCCFTLNDKGNLFGKGLSPLQAFNSTHIKSARLSMLSNIPVKDCRVCYDWEKEGIESHRQKMNNKYQKYEKFYDTTHKDGSVSQYPIYLDFRFGNLCNFSCRMCGSYASSSWSKEDKYYGVLDKDAPNHYDHWTNNEEFWKDIDQIKKYIRVLYFAGGEPFVQEGHYKMLKFLVESGCAKNIKISYNTNLSYNGSFKGYSIESLWEQFDSVDLWPSIEGFDERAEYGRKGLDINLFKENSLKYSKYITTFSIVSSIYSITSNMELIRWIKSIGKTFNITNLTNPGYQSTSVLSKTIKKQIINDYKHSLLSLQTLDEYELQTILGSLKHMNSRDDSNLQSKFKEMNLKSDLFRNESFESVFPELAEWYRNI
jgi:organic radical activating enzyme